MSDKKVLKKNLSNILLPFAATIVAAVIIYVLYVPHYADYENAYINSLLKGTYTGLPERFLYFISYPFALFLSKIAGLSIGSNVFGVLLAIINLLVFYNVMALTVSRFKRVVHKYIWAVLILLFFFIFLFKASVLVDYRFIGSVAAGAFLFDYLSVGSMKKLSENILGSVLGFIFMLVSAGLNPVAFRSCLLVMILCVIYKLLSEAMLLSDKFECSLPVAMTNIKLGLFIIMPLVSVVIWLLNRIFSQKYYGESNFTLSGTTAWLPTLLLAVLPALMDFITVLFSNYRHKTRMSKATARQVVSAALSAICIIAIPICVFTCINITQKYNSLCEAYETSSHVNDYFRLQPEKLFIVDESFFLQATDKVFEKEASFKNYVSYSGIETTIPHYANKISKYEISGPLQGLIKENVSLVSSDPNLMLDVENYFETAKQDITVTEDIVFTSDTYTMLCYDIKPDPFRNDFLSDEYNSVFLSQYSCDSFSADYFDMYTGEKTFFFPVNLSVKELVKKLDTALSSRPEMENVWLFVDPFNYDYSPSNSEAVKYLDRLTSMIGNYPDVTFHVLLNFPSANTWNSAASSFDAKFASYTNVVESLSTLQNVPVCFPGAERWALLNKNVNDGQKIDLDFAKTLVVEWIAGFYPASGDTLETTLNEISVEIHSFAQQKFVDLSSATIVCFGDSIIGNYRDITGIGGIVETLTNATVVNNAVGGTTATTDLSIATQDYFNGEYVTNAIYVINYGLNDSFLKYPINGEISFSQGLINGIDEIRSHDPGSRIIIISPAYLDVTNPDGTEKQNLTSYVEACEKVAEQNNCYYIDNYSELGFNSENWLKYVYDDRTHLNQRGRIEFAMNLVNHLTEWFN